MTAAFVDSGAFIALLDRRDRRHAAVEAMFTVPPKRLVTSVHVLAETQGWFLHRLGEEASRRFLGFLSVAPFVEIVGADLAHHRATLQKLDALRGRKLTYVDASSLVHLAQQRLRVVWGCDADLGLEGARVVPGPPR